MNEIVDIPIDLLVPNPHNPRCDVGDVTDLAESIKAQGVKQNLLVVPYTESTGPNETRQVYRVVIGHRRLAAARQAGLGSLPCKVEVLTEREEREIMILENTQRSDLKPIEEADAYQGLLDLGANVAEMAEKTGRSRSFVRQRLRVARIPQAIRDETEGFAQLSIRELTAISEFDDQPDLQERLARSASNGGNFNWELTRCRDDRDDRKWVQAARAYIREHHLNTLPDGSKPQSFWNGDVKGYDTVANLYRSGGSFQDQYEALATDGGHDRDDLTVHVFAGGCAIVYKPEPADSTAEPDPREEERRLALAEKTAVERPWKTFHELSRRTRIQWLRERLELDRSGKPRVTRAAADFVQALAPVDMNAIIGGGLRSGVDYEDRVCEAVSAITTPLPVTEKDPKHNVYHIMWGANRDELARRLHENPAHATAVLLAARAEAAIDWKTWMNDETRTNTIHPWYRALETLGYPISDTEKAALDGTVTKEQ